MSDQEQKQNIVRLEICFKSVEGSLYFFRRGPQRISLSLLRQQFDVIRGEAKSRAQGFVQVRGPFGKQGGIRRLAAGAIDNDGKLVGVGRTLAQRNWSSRILLGPATLAAGYNRERKDKNRCLKVKWRNPHYSRLQTALRQPFALA